MASDGTGTGHLRLKLLPSSTTIAKPSVPTEATQGQDRVKWLQSQLLLSVRYKRGRRLEKEPEATNGCKRMMGAWGKGPSLYLCRGTNLLDLPELLLPPAV